MDMERKNPAYRHPAGGWGSLKAVARIVVHERVSLSDAAALLKHSTRLCRGLLPRVQSIATPLAPCGRKQGPRGKIDSRAHRPRIQSPLKPMMRRSGHRSDSGSASACFRRGIGNVAAGCLSRFARIARTGSIHLGVSDKGIVIAGKVCIDRRAACPISSKSL